MFTKQKILWGNYGWSIIIYPIKKFHIAKLEDLLKALLKNRCKISPKKCQLFRPELQYMGNTIFVQDLVNFLSMFCPELQKLLKPIYDLTRKGWQFIWGEEQQTAFEEIKCSLVKLPVLHQPNSTGRFHLYSNMSKFATVSALYHLQNGRPK